jgi:hypothetical protein
MNIINASVNGNSNLNAQDAAHRMAHIAPEEQPYEGAGFPGCGDGSDDLADMNANEADDYRNEDAGLDGYWESLTDLGD